MTAEDFARYEGITLKVAKISSGMRAGYANWKVTLMRKGYKQRTYVFPFIENYVPTEGEILRILSHDAAVFEKFKLYENFKTAVGGDGKETKNAYRRCRKAAADMSSFVDDYRLFLELE